MLNSSRMRRMVSVSSAVSEGSCQRPARPEAAASAGSQRAHDLQTALCAVGQAAGLCIGEVGHVEDVQQLESTFGAALLFLPVVGQADERGAQIVLHGLVEAHLDVVDDGQVLEQADILESTSHAHPVDLIGLFAGGGHPIDEDGAAGGW